MEKVKKYYNGFRQLAMSRSLQIALVLSLFIAAPFMAIVMFWKVNDDTKTVKYETEQMANDMKFILLANEDHADGENNMRKVFSHYEVFNGDTFTILDESGEKPEYTGESEVYSYITSFPLELLSNIVSKIEVGEYQKDWIAPTRIYLDKEKEHFIYETKHHVAHDNHVDEIIIKRDLTEIYAKTVRNGLVHGSMTILLVFLVVFILYILLTKKQARVFKNVIDEQQRLIFEGDEKTNVGKRHGEHLGHVSSMIIKLHAQANEVYETNKNILQDVSHETSSCLMEIKQSADLIRYYGVENPERIEVQLKRIDGAVSKISLIQGAFTDLAKIENSKMLPSPSTYYAKELVNYAVLEASKEYPQAEFIQCCCTEVDKQIRIHREHFKMIMKVLLENAVKYSINSNEISICILDEPSYKNKVAIKVTNWGVYIPVEERARIFERYYRARNVRNMSGVGIGLHIVKKVIKLYDGNIIVESDLSGETSFIIIFPETKESETTNDN